MAYSAARMTSRLLPIDLPSSEVYRTDDLTVVFTQRWVRAAKPTAEVWAHAFDKSGMIAWAVAYDGTTYQIYGVTARPALALVASYVGSQSGLTARIMELVKEGAL